MTILDTAPHDLTAAPGHDTATPPAMPPPAPTRGLRRLFRGPTDDPRWARPALVGLLGLTALLYLWNLGASGWGNSFYAAAAQAGAQSWKALLFGSLDAGNAITVDKPPAAMWVMGLSARIFGVNAWSILAPQALMGVASVALLYAAVKRWFGPAAGLLAGAALALTPVAVLMFRFNNPDALLVLLMVAAGYACVRAVEVASGKWLALVGALLGLGFLTKMMQAFLVLPAFALVYLVAAPTGLLARIRHLLLAGVALLVSGGWFVVLVSLWPASSRPYIAGSTNNTLWELAIGYNGLGRILGGSGSAGGNGGGGGMGGGGNTGFGGSTGIGRLFGTSMGTEISWLLPTALIALVAVLVATARSPRTDKARAAAILWGAWLIVTGATFSFMSGTIHPYYTVALAPAIAALTALGARVLWVHRHRIAARLGLAAMVLAAGVWGSVLLGRTGWQPGLRWGALAVSIVAALALLTPVARSRRIVVVAVIAAILSTGASTAGYATATAATTHSGSIPSSGPAGLSTGMGGGMGGPGRMDRPAGMGGTGWPGTPGANSTGSAAAPGSASGTGTGSVADTGPGTGFGSPAGGGPGGGRSADAAVTALLKTTTTRWSAAVTGATSAAELELASGTSIIALGGWNGGDPAPTLAQFQAYVTNGQIRYYVSGGGMGGGRGGPGGETTDSSQIATWVAAHYTAITVGSSTLYDLTAPTS